MKSTKGFTLIEIMVSLVLVGLIASIAGTSVLVGIQGYLAARDNDVLAQKAQLALNRLHREFIELSDVRDAREDCILYESPYGRRALKMAVETDGRKTIQFIPGVTSISCDQLPSGDTLIDGVQGFTLLYNPSGGMSLWSVGQDIRNLYALNARLVMKRSGTETGLSFSLTVSPRNNNNAGGARVPTPDDMPPAYPGKTCFVATAAWGDRDHPMVVFFRQFRDRFLLGTVPGDALIRLYWRVGPLLAAAIEDSPPARFAVRAAMVPLAGAALLLLYHPVLPVLALIVSWCGARFLCRRLRRKPRPGLQSPAGQRGAILLTLIAMMVIFSALGAYMISMFGSSSLGQAVGSNIMRAYYLAESGFRYAASVYINAADESARETLMEAMRNREYTLAGNEGRFQLGVYPYYFKSTKPPDKDQMEAKVYGNIPVKIGDMNSAATAVWMKVQKPGGDITFNRVYLTPAAVSDNAVIFKQVAASGTTPVDWGSGYWDSATNRGSTLTPACIPDPNKLVLIADSGGYDLAYAYGTGALAFPRRNGVFAVRFQGEPRPRILSYRERDDDQRRFKGIADTSGKSLPTTVPVVDPGATPPYNQQSFIELTKFVRLESTGIIGEGVTAIKRTVTYETPIGYVTVTAPKTEMKEQFGTGLANWFTGSEPSHIGTQAVEGGALRLTGAATTNVMPASSCLLFRENQIALDWRKAFSASGAYENFSTEWRRAGNFLSYDVQAKLFLDSTNTIYAGGLSFRLDEQGNSLGLSIVRASPNPSPGCDADGIPDNLTTAFHDSTFPNSFTVLYSPYAYLVLWMKETAKTEQNIVTVPSPHLDPESTSYLDPPPSGTGTRAILLGDCSFWRSGARVRFYNTGGSLPTGIEAGKDYYIRVIFYNTKRYVYLFDTYARAMGLGASRWEGLQDITSEGSGASSMAAQDPQWLLLAYRSLNQYPSSVGDVLEILKPSGGGLYERFRDWMTLKVRVIEAPSLSFVNGGGAGLEIVSGDILYQTQDNTAGGAVEAIAMVRNDPVYWNLSVNQPAEWNWEAGTAAGIVLLEPLRDDKGVIRPYQGFIGGKRLFRGQPPSGVWIATVGIPATVSGEGVPFRQRDNWAQVFVGDPNRPPDPGDDPLDVKRAQSPRDSVFWAPDRVGYPGITTPSNDRFTLVRMADDNAYRNPCYLRRFLSRQNTGDSRGDFIRIGKVQYDGRPFFSTPTEGLEFPTSRPEVGLHAYGPADSITNFYFDDFAVRFGPVGGVRPGFLMPVQH